jgi:Holliday junction DNA helicase RuvA
MYHHITGKLVQKAAGEVVVDVHGVGYLLRIPISTYFELPGLGSEVTLYTHLHVTDDALSLFGFRTINEREFFQQLQTVQRVGPKVSLSVLSGGRLEHIQQAIRLGDVAFLKKIKGVGEANAKRIVLELGKILVQQATPEPAATEPTAAPAKKGRGKKAESVPTPQTFAATPATQALENLDQMTSDAVQLVGKLQEVDNAVALSAVQKAMDAYRKEGAKPETVQALVRKAMAFTD